MEDGMESLRPSRYDRMLAAADEAIRQGYAYLADDDDAAVDELRREWNCGPVRRETGWDD
jgi:hypothetical protein